MAVMVFVLPSVSHAARDALMEVCAPIAIPQDLYPVSRPGSLRDLFVPNDDQLEIIGRLGKGIYQWKTGRDHGWWECGKFYQKGPNTEDRALLLAYRLVKAAHKYSDDEVTINVWGLAATIAHESSFDRCAVGPHFRQWAIDKGLIQKRRRTISYGEKEMLAALNSPKARWWFDNTGVDVGFCQLLTRFYNGHHQDLMHPEKGIEICAEQFHRRASRLNTQRPWRWWRGHKATWYDDRVTYRARRLGATRKEI